MNNGKRLAAQALRIFALIVLGVAAARGAVLEETIEEVHDISPTASLTVRNTDGRIFIYGSDENKLRVTALKRAFTKPRLESIAVRVAKKGEAVTIETSIPQEKEGLLADRSGTVDYTILLPQTCKLSKVELAKGEILIEGIRESSIEARLGAGRFLVRNCFAEVRLSQGRGGMDVFYAWWEEEPFTVQAQLGEGDLDLSLPIDVRVGIDAATSSGHITNRFAEKKNHQGRALNITLGENPTARFKLRTTSGNIRIDKSD